MSLVVVGVLEFSSIAIGIKVLDEMVKLAPINIIEAKTMCPGKYLIVFSGDVASVEYSFNRGLEVGEKFLVDSLYLPQIHQSVVPAIGNIVDQNEWNAIGLVETLSVVSAIEAADIAAKTGDVNIIEVRIAIGFGGKSYVKMMGSLDEVQIAVDNASKALKEKNQYCMDIIIPQPHKEIKPFFIK